MNRSVGFLVLMMATGGGLRAAPIVVTSDSFVATFARGALTSLHDRQGNVFVGEEGGSEAVVLHRLGKDHRAGAEEGPAAVGAGGRATVTYSAFSDLAGASAVSDYAVDKGTGDLVVTQSCKSLEKGVWGVEWPIASIPLQMNVVVPGCSGIKLTKTSSTGSMTFDYPLSWEAQFVLVEGKGRGFYIWAEDVAGRYKRLTVERGAKGWKLGLSTINNAPFEGLASCDSVKWHLNVYEGDWRVPARRYRKWAEEHFGPTRIPEQKPTWVKDTRCCVIMGMDLPQLEALAKRLDPRQTLVYLPDWRRAGYDRNYPTYDEPYNELGPFLTRAHELGYRVMVHVNYFGCDPLNTLYQQFEPFQVRSPWGNHDKEWWLWERADPIIKFAYINPAHKPWRDLFVSRMKKLCETFPIDALHLDQTLCIYNDNSGLINGMTMIQGNVALHRELRAALPNVALSGEGLDEVTYRYEAFAQRHSWGLNFVEGTWSKAALQMAHPISSFLLRPYTLIYGYLGCAPPTSGQLYAAWNENYDHWGVIPTLKPDTGQIVSPSGFSKQFYDEVKLWQEQRVDLDLEAAWPEEVFFPWKTAKGDRVLQTADGRLLWGNREISRTISGVSEVKLPGTIPGWRVYDRERLFGLQPASWYPYSTEPRDMKAFHVEKLPDGFTATTVALRDDMAVIRTEQTDRVIANMGDLLGEAVCGSKPFDEGEGSEMKGPLSSPDGAGFSGDGSLLQAHPPWRATRKNPQTGVLEANGTGIAYARFSLRLPDTGKLRYTSKVAMDSGAIGEGKTDGVTYRVRASAGQQEAHAELHNATSQQKELGLDLTAFAGKQISLELSVHPGPNNSATFDWARWYEPRVERDREADAEMSVVAPAEVTNDPARRWSLALTGTEQRALKSEGNRYTMTARLPGTVFLLHEAPPLAQLPLDVARAPFKTTYAGNSGILLEAPQFATATPGESTVGGVKRLGLFTHPPDQGRTVVDYAMTLPALPAEFHTFIGIRDGSKSEGVDFIVEANGVELARETRVPGEWHEVTCDLSPWAGKPIVLSLIADADGSFGFDWAHWGEPTIRLK